MSIQLEDDEIRPQLQLSAEEIAALEQERRDILLGGITRKSDARPIRGEGSALDVGPALKPLEKQATVTRIAPEPAPLRAINADPEVVARMVKAASEAQATFDTASEMFKQAEHDLAETRAALFAYLGEHGIPVA